MCIFVGTAAWVPMRCEAMQQHVRRTVHSHSDHVRCIRKLGRFQSTSSQVQWQLQWQLQWLLRWQLQWQLQWQLVAVTK